MSLDCTSTLSTTSMNLKLFSGEVVFSSSTGRTYLFTSTLGTTKMIGPIKAFSKKVFACEGRPRLNCTATLVGNKRIAILCGRDANAVVQDSLYWLELKLRRIHERTFIVSEPLFTLYM